MRSPRALWVALWLAAFSLRILPTLLAGGGHAVLEYDDGVHLGAAIRLLDGQIPYGDITFVQPPGILYLLLPFAALARVTSEPTAMLAARVLFAAIGATTTVLIGLTVARRSPRAGLLAGLFYACSATAVAAERTVLLEPVLSLSLVASLAALESGRPRYLLSALAAAAGAVTKIWLLPLFPVLAFVVYRREGWRACLRWMAVSVGAVAALVAPFVVLAGGKVFQQVVVDQAGRARVWNGLQARLTYMDWVGTPGALARLNGTGFALLAVVLLLVAAVSLTRKNDRAWGVTTSICLALVLVAPAFFYHYGSFVAAPEAVALGVVLARVRPAVLHSAVVAVVVAGACLANASLIVHEATKQARFPAAAIQAALGSESCVWTRSAATAIALDVERSRCANVLDDYSVILATGGGTGRANEFTGSAAYQAATMKALSAATDVVLVPGDRDHWTAETGRSFDEHFQQSFAADGAQVFVFRRR